jgi:hypothetical protein
MTELSGTTQHVLGACARAMAQRQVDSSLNLSRVNGDFQRSGGAAAMLAFLAREVELHSDGALTVRWADPALSDSQIQGICFHLAVCPATVPADEAVKAVSQDITLYAIGPYRSGLWIEQPVSPERVAEYRARVAEARQRQQEADQLRREAADRAPAVNQGRQEAQDLRRRVYEAVCRLQSKTTDPQIRRHLEYYTYRGERYLELEHVAAVCVIAGQDFRGFLRTILES